MGRSEKAAAYSTALLIVSFLIAFTGLGGKGVFLLACIIVMAAVSFGIILMIFAFFFLLYEALLK